MWHTSHVLRVLSYWAFSLGSAASNSSCNIIRPKENSLWDTRVFMMQMHLEISFFLGYKKSIEKSKCCYCSSLTSNTYIQNSDPIWIQWTGDLEEGKWMKLVLALELWQGGTADLPDKSQGCEWFSIQFHFIFFIDLRQREKRMKNDIWIFYFSHVRLTMVGENEIISFDKEEIITFHPNTVVSFHVSLSQTYLDF